MPDNVTLNPGIGGAVVASDLIGGAQFQRIKLIHGDDGINGGDVSASNPLPVIINDDSPLDVVGPITNAELRASPIAVTANTGLSQPLTDAQLRASPVRVNGTLGAGDLLTDAWGIQKVSLPHSLFHGMWTFDIPAAMWFMYENGIQVYTSTRVASVGGVARLDTTGATSVLLESRETPRYQPNRGHLFSTAGWLPNKNALAVRDFGLFTVDNGVFFRLKSDGMLYAVLRSGGVETYEHVIDTSAMPGFDVEKNNVYDIQFQWRSAGNYKFFIGDPVTGTSKLVHVIDNLGKLVSASIEDPALPIAFKATTLGDTVTMNIGCADVTSENGSMSVHQFESSFIDGRSVNGTNVPVMIVYSPLTINGRTNTRGLQLARITVNCSKKATFRVWSGRDPASITGATFQTINSGSFVQTDSPSKAAGAVSATSVNTALLRNISSINVEAAVAREVTNPLRERITFPLVRGDYLIVTCTVASASADCVIEWGESI